MAKKSKRPQLYATKFVGVSRAMLDTFKERINPPRHRARAFYLFVSLLLDGDWNFQTPENPFRCRRRWLYKSIGWRFEKIRHYRQVLVDAEIVSLDKKRTSLTYSINCDVLGIVEATKRSKQRRRQPYRRGFWGLTRQLKDNLKKKLRQDPDVSACLWLLSNMLVHSNWTAKTVAEPFSISQSALSDATGWDVRTVRRYIRKLIESGFLFFDMPAGPRRAASYILDTTLAGIITGAENPTKRMDFS